jgi:C4-dicarboxylate-specific signal transduction histidine kinase
MSDLDTDDARQRRRHGNGTATAVTDANRAWPLRCAAGMAAIIAALRAARAPVPDQIKLVDNLTKIEREARRVTDAIRGFAQFAHHAASDIGTADLDVVLAGALACVDDDVRRHGIAVRLDISPGLPTVAADPTAVGHVSACLMRNAIDALSRGTGERREISIAAAPNHDGMIEVSVADTGPGIDPEFARTIFDPFAADRPREWGVGLAVSRTILEALGGRIGVKSNSRQGAVVAFVLPPAKRKCE